MHLLVHCNYTTPHSLQEAIAASPFRALRGIIGNSTCLLRNQRGLQTLQLAFGDQGTLASNPRCRHGCSRPSSTSHASLHLQVPPGLPGLRASCTQMSRALSQQLCSISLSCLRAASSLTDSTRASCKVSGLQAWRQASLLAHPQPPFSQLFPHMPAPPGHRSSSMGQAGRQRVQAQYEVPVAQQCRRVHRHGCRRLSASQTC